MNKKRVKYLALAAFLSVVSCSHETTEQDIYDWTEESIFFKTSLSGVSSSRAQEMTFDRLASFQVTCFNTSEKELDNQGHLSPYFENSTFFRRTNTGIGTYESVISYDWPSNKDFLRFFAFSPSLDIMATDNSSSEDEYFNLINTSRIVTNADGDKTEVSIEYRLGNIRINPDISQQFDFITAEAAGTRQKDFMGGVELTFSHRLCQIELKAWGENESNDFEIAGVRIGNPVVEGTFVFADDVAKDLAGEWEIPENPLKDKVDYKYQTGDNILRINSSSHNSQASAASIMGNGGFAMVLPTKNEKWEGLDDPNIGNIPYTTDKMYLSILMRVTDSASGKVVYPYPGNKKGMTVIRYAVDPSGVIKYRLYTRKTEGKYFTDPDLRNPYLAAEGEEVKDFGWAAVPVDADWSAGKKYVYTLDYSEGIGVHDPSDPDPGKTISTSKNMVIVDVEVTDWKEGDNTDVSVPRK